jgi:hypothetical protein
VRIDGSWESSDFDSASLLPGLAASVRSALHLRCGHLNAYPTVHAPSEYILACSTVATPVQGVGFVEKKAAMTDALDVQC